MTDIVQQQWHNRKQTGKTAFMCKFKARKHGVVCCDAARYKFDTKYLWIHFSLAWNLM